MTDDVDYPVTLEDVFEYHIDLVDEQAEEFPGDLPNQGVSAILSAAQGFDAILRRNEMLQANDELEEKPQDDDISHALEEQAVDLLAALSNLKREYDLDIEEAFRTRRAKMEAMRSADSMEELMEAMDEAGVKLEGLEGPDIKAGDNVDMDDYDPEDRDRGTY